MVWAVRRCTPSKPSPSPAYQMMVGQKSVMPAFVKHSIYIIYIYIYKLILMPICKNAAWKTQVISHSIKSCMLSDVFIGWTCPPCHLLLQSYPDLANFFAANTLKIQLPYNTYFGDGFICKSNLAVHAFFNTSSPASVKQLSILWSI